MKDGESRRDSVEYLGTVNAVVVELTNFRKTRTPLEISIWKSVIFYGRSSKTIACVSAMSVRMFRACCPFESSLQKPAYPQRRAPDVG